MRKISCSFQWSYMERFFSHAGLYLMLTRKPTRRELAWLWFPTACWCWSQKRRRPGWPSQRQYLRRRHRLQAKNGQCLAEVSERINPTYCAARYSGRKWWEFVGPSGSANTTVMLHGRIKHKINLDLSWTYSDCEGVGTSSSVSLGRDRRAQDRELFKI